jgi:glyoxylase-like metal-dependent hydrolase (beta-lactamase superfamily II)
MQVIGSNILETTGYPGVNVGAIVSDQGIVAVDAPTVPAHALDWFARLRQRTGQPIRYLVLTDYHIDRTLSAHLLETPVVCHEKTEVRLAGYESRFPALLLDTLALRYDVARRDLNGALVVRPQISFGGAMAIQCGQQTVQLVHRPSATSGSIWVLVTDSKVLFSGDSVVVNQHPNLSEAESAPWLAALDSLAANELGSCLIVPGRGPLCESSAAIPIAEFIRCARERVLALYGAGRPRADTTALVTELLGAFPSDSANREWLLRQLKTGLDHLYDEIKGADPARRGEPV